MKILLVANMYPSKAFPSYGVFVRNTENILLDAGFNVEKVVLQKKMGKVAKLLGYAKYYASIVKNGLRTDIDVLYVHYAAHNAFPLLLLKKMKPSVKIVTNVHGSDVVPEVQSQEKFQPYVKRLLEISTTIITPSNYYKKLVRKKYGVTTPIEVFPSGGVNETVFYPQHENRDSLCSDLGLDPSFRYVGLVNRLDVGKGWQFFVEAAAQYIQENRDSDVRFIVVGSGKEEDAFKQSVLDQNLQNHLIHFPLMKQQDLAKIYNVIEVFVFPTIREGESLGLVGLESMACRTPIIGSAMAGLLDYTVDGKNGWLFEPSNANDLYVKLVHVLSLSRLEREKIAEQAYLTAQTYEQKAVQPKLAQIFSSIEQG
ncbi:glycosyltransferase [Paenisporosarcina cavernae]|uniref:Glycosyltransferase n=1 Tax=Paenisporosarcina cavernae TaxID=2320858 RepID=A0A385YQY8_9BACL|nr:glycosyltransferase [Paenisporosarcina cavernae]AYC28914.1 glycosyltransferase [Paenisporosarcina cavernae]